MPPFFMLEACTLAISTGPWSIPRWTSVATGFTGVPVERLAAPGRVEAQHTGTIGAGDFEGVGDASRRAGDAADTDGVLLAIKVHDDLTLQHDHRLV